MKTSDIVSRLTAIENEVAGLKAAYARIEKPHPVQALERIHGTFEDDQAFREAARLGRRWRQGDRAPGQKANAKAKRK